MSVRQNHRLWPYLGIVWCLFVLSVMAPRSWRRVAVDTESPSSKSRVRAEAKVSSRDQVKAPRANSSGTSLESAYSTGEPAPQQHATEPKQEASPQEASPQESFVTAREEVLPVESVRDSLQMAEAESETEVEKVVSASSGEVSEDTTENFFTSAPKPTTGSTALVSGPDDRLAMLIPEPVSIAKMEMPIFKPKQEVARPEPFLSVPKRLLERLDQLAVQSPTSDWAIETADLLRDMTDPKNASFPSVEHLGAGSQASFGPRFQITQEPGKARPLTLEQIKTLEASLSSASAVAQQMNPGPLRSEMLRARYALARRVDVWSGAANLAESKSVSASDVRQTALDRRQALARRLEEVAKLNDGSASGKAWAEYLMLSQLSGVARSEALGTSQEGKELIDQALLRISRAKEESTAQRKYVEQMPVVELEQELKHWLAKPVDLPNVLAEIEEYESKPRSSTAQRLAENMRSLSWNADPESRDLAKLAERHYRNANLRVALSAVLANRFLPQPKTVQQDVYDTILGAEVEGVSNTSTRLSLQLVPKQGEVRFNLEAEGMVDSETASSAGPAVFHSEGSTSFRASKQFALSPSGRLESVPAYATANGASDLLDVETDYDAVPLVGHLVRRMAMSQHDKSHGQALEEVESKVADTARERLDEETRTGLDRIRNKVDQRVLAPSRNLGLTPEVLELTTTSQRIVARLRLADEDQLAAHTPRPRAPSDSHLSVQLHQSAINNAIEQLALEGKTFKLPVLYRTVVARFRGIEDIDSIEPPEDMPRNASVTLNSKDAIQVKFVEGKVHITLGIKQLRMRRSRYGPVRVHAIYTPEVSGVRASLEREGVVRLESDKKIKTGSQIVLRSVFGKVFSKNQPLPVVTEKMANDPRLKGLAVNQFVLRDGWLGIALGPDRKIARSRASQSR